MQSRLQNFSLPESFIPPFFKNKIRFQLLFIHSIFQILAFFCLHWTAEADRKRGRCNRQERSPTGIDPLTLCWPCSNHRQLPRCSRSTFLQSLAVLALCIYICHRMPFSVFDHKWTEFTASVYLLFCLWLSGSCSITFTGTLCHYHFKQTWSSLSGR